MKFDKDELTIYEVESLHQTLIKEFNEGDVILDMQKVNKVDMSIIQLFISTQKSCLDNSKLFQLQNLNAELSKIFASCECSFLKGESSDQ